MALLELQDISVHYGRIQALDGVSINVEAGEIVSLIGANGAGKTTTMRAISGIRPLSSGKIVFDGEDITKLRADLRVVRGISQSPEGRGVFPGMTVMENLDMGAYARKDRKSLSEDYERVFTLFPRLAERKSQTGGTMSGG
ncbi:ABC transporter ATP-binding protein, partial [Acidocella sp.]|uniref:ABC transporter ATP-binding protein n=1 Tax=Acidocella sp. TaxID=50710 RepID=UPI002F4270ED